MEDTLSEVRALLLIRGFGSTSLYPAPVEAIHVCNYFADALAPVWGGEPLNPAVLKRAGTPKSRKLQVALDRLVGRGMLLVENVTYELTPSGLELRCTYHLNEELTYQFTAFVDTDDHWTDSARFYTEVATAVATLGNLADEGLLADASYSDPLLDINTVVNLASDPYLASRTVQVNERLAELSAEKFGRSLEPSELTNLYLRHLFNIATGGAAAGD